LKDYHYELVRKIDGKSKEGKNKKAGKSKEKSKTKEGKNNVQEQGSASKKLHISEDEDEIKIDKNDIINNPIIIKFFNKVNEKYNIPVIKSQNVLKNIIKINTPSERVQCDYDSEQKYDIEDDKTSILSQLNKLSRKSVIFENQKKIASKVVTAFKNRKIINIMVVSKTQSGKTGSMCATIKQYLEDTSNLIPIENIYIITGLSSIEWKEQTKERMPESMQKRVFQRCELPNTFVDEIKGKKNILIIMDEIQVAAKKGQTIYNTFTTAGLLDKSKLYENDIKILEYTATPDGTIYDLMKWGDASNKILADVGDGYISSFDLLQAGRVKQYKDLCGYDKKTKKINKKVFENIKEVKNDIDNYRDPKYHIFRTKNGPEQDLTIKNFKKIFNPDNYDFIKYDGESEIVDINNTLKNPPEKHTFIFIKEMLRCAKTLKKRYIGILYDRYSGNPDDTTIIQGLVGRDTGYDNNGVSICYTNIDSINRYEELWQSNFEDKTIKWNSKTTKYTNGILSGKDTFNDPKNYDGFSVASDDSDELKKPIIEKFKTQKEAKEYYNKELKAIMGGRGPNKIMPNNDGYYEATIRSNKKIYSCDEVECERKQGLTENNFRFYPCYEDINDKSTLQWWFIHY
jgi:hypothetical protein